ncbi:hypothetical protein KUCAC02_001230, partial [Chaenocephalus aceratus]
HRGELSTDDECLPAEDMEDIQTHLQPLHVAWPQNSDGSAGRRWKGKIRQKKEMCSYVVSAFGRRTGPDCNPYFCLQKPALEEQYQAKEGKDEEGEILAVLLSPSPSLPCSLLPGSAGRQMTRAEGRSLAPVARGGNLAKEQTNEEEEDAPSPLVRGQEHHYSQMSSLTDGEAPPSFLRCCL